MITLTKPKKRNSKTVPHSFVEKLKKFFEFLGNDYEGVEYQFDYSASKEAFVVFLSAPSLTTSEAQEITDTLEKLEFDYSIPQCDSEGITILLAIGDSDE